MTSYSGSENRQRKIIHPVRMNEEEYMLLKQKAEICNISLGKLMRDSVLGRKIVPRETRNAIADLGRLGGLFKLAVTKDHLAAYRGEFGKILTLISETIKKLDSNHDWESDSSQEE